MCRHYLVVFLLCFFLRGCWVWATFSRKDVKEGGDYGQCDKSCVSK